MRSLDNWLQSYLEYTENQESPEKLHLWTALCIMSASIRRQLWLNRGYYKLYPNLFVLIVAESATARKSAAMDIGLKLLNEAIPDIVTISGSMTPEGLFKQMNRQVLIENPKDKKKPIVRQDSHILVHADELASLFGYDRVRASRMAIFLTEIYNSSKDEQKHTTSKDGQIIVRNPYLSLLAATAPQNLKVLPEEAVGGLIGRLIFVHAKEKGKVIAWPDPTTRDADLWEKLTVDLFRIAHLEGEIIPTTEARNLFQKWYEGINERKVEDPRLEAFHNRCHDTAIKVAILLSLAKSDKLILEAEDMAMGIALIEKQMPEFSRVINWAAATVYSQNRAKLIDFMKRSGGASNRRLMMKAMAISHEEMSLLLQSLVEEGTFKVVQLANKDAIYRLSSEELNR